VPYRIPTFNLFCDIYSGGGVGAFPVTLPPVGVARITNQECALIYGSRTQVASTGGTGSVGVPLLSMNLVVPEGTDVRGLQDSLTGPDIVEVPSGSGRWYGVAWVDDIGKGYLNEHRTAMIAGVVGGWAPPYG
jgi:hypothetical protein